jgi:DNA-binding winged helix-turn-helix (wHTH) protein
MDRKARVLLADEKPVILAHREMKLLEKLASSPSRVFVEDLIGGEVWGDHIRRSLPALSGLLRRLRQKMVMNGLPDPVKNVRGRGFSCSNRFASMPRLLSDEAYGGHMKRIQTNASTSLVSRCYCESHTEMMANKSTMVWIVLGLGPTA